MMPASGANARWRNHRFLLPLVRGGDAPLLQSRLSDGVHGLRMAGLRGLPHYNAVLRICRAGLPVLGLNR